MNHPVRPDPASERPPAAVPSSLSWSIGAGTVLVLAATLAVGLHLGSMPWRFRMQLWQLQGALTGGVAGMVVGYALGRSHRKG